MARLPRKKPTAAKKKKQKGTAKTDSRPTASKKEKAGTQAVQGSAVQNRVALPRSETPRPVKPTGRSLKPAFVAKSVQFLREVKVELKKVTWPSRKETAASTVVVIILVFIISAFLGLVDIGLSNLIRMVLG
jgi:preprotein translocase subunit SecE